MNGIRKLGRILVVSSLALVPVLATWSCSKPAEETTTVTETPAPATTAVTPPADAPEWGYEQAGTGPAEWGKLSPAFVACAEGLSQSPIDIAGTESAELPAFQAAYRPAELRIVHHLHTSDVVNTGHSIQVNFPNGDTLMLGDRSYALAQFHFHSPSEHTVRGKQYPMEMHLVHKAPDGSLAVVGAFVEEGAHNAAFDGIWANLPGAKGEETHLPNVPVDLQALLPSDRRSYRYEGSLTTPPCSEGVRWTILATPIMLSAEQIATFRKVMHGNNRPVQGLNGRKVVTDVLPATSSN